MLYFFGGISIFFHTCAFIMESILFMRPKTFKLFGLRSAEDAGIVKLMAFNQGFYNLFLALVLLVGLILAQTPEKAMIGIGLALGAAFCMTGAGAILIISKPSAWFAGLIQSISPLIVMVNLFYKIA
jgi:putative membrane protein